MNDDAAASEEDLWLLFDLRDNVVCWDGNPRPPYWRGSAQEWADTVLPMPEVRLRLVNRRMALFNGMSKRSVLAFDAEPALLRVIDPSAEGIDKSKLYRGKHSVFNLIKYELTFADRPFHQLMKGGEFQQACKELGREYTTNQRLNPGALSDLSALRGELVHELNALAEVVRADVRLVRGALLLPLSVVNDQHRLSDPKIKLTLNRLTAGQVASAEEVAKEWGELLAPSLTRERLAPLDGVLAEYYGREPVTDKDLLAAMASALFLGVVCLETLLERAAHRYVQLLAVETILQFVRAGERIRKVPVIQPKKWEKGGGESVVIWKGSSKELGRILDQWRKELVSDKEIDAGLELDFNPESRRSFAKKISQFFSYTPDSLRAYMQQGSDDFESDSPLADNLRSLRRFLEPYFIRRRDGW